MKTKALINFVVTVKLICTIVSAFAKCWFSHKAAQMLAMLEPSHLNCSSILYHKYTPLTNLCTLKSHEMLHIYMLTVLTATSVMFFRYLFQMVSKCLFPHARIQRGGGGGGGGGGQLDPPSSVTKNYHFRWTPSHENFWIRACSCMCKFLNFFSFQGQNFVSDSTTKVSLLILFLLLVQLIHDIKVT